MPGMRGRGSSGNDWRDAGRYPKIVLHTGRHRVQDYSEHVLAGIVLAQTSLESRRELSHGNFTSGPQSASDPVYTHLHRP
jgi:hypothetical protein